MHLLLGRCDLRDAGQVVPPALGMLLLGLMLDRRFGGLNGGRSPELA